MDTFVETLDENSVRVLFYKEFFEREAIFNAAYKMQHSFYIKIEPFEEDRVAVIMLKKEKQCIADIEKALKEFCNEVVDQQIRLDLEVRTNKIRDCIYQKAFKVLNDQKESDSL